MIRNQRPKIHRTDFIFRVGFNCMSGDLPGPLRKILKIHCTIFFYIIITSSDSERSDVGL